MTRSLKKGPFVASHVFERVEQMNASGKKDIMFEFNIEVDKCNPLYW